VAYQRLETAEELELAGEVGRALEERVAAAAQVPENPEIAFWTALSLAGAGRVEEARRTIGVAFGAHTGWAELLRRLAADDLIELPSEALTVLLAEGRAPGDG
jgi:hypothetical protein